MPYPAKLSRESVLDAAQQLVEGQGAEALSMRTLAERLAVRPSSLYRHFAHREALLWAIGEQAARGLQQALQDAAAGQPARPALDAAARAYLAYARQHPHLYALLLTQPPELTPEQLAAGAGKHLWNTLLALVGSLSGNPDDTPNAVALWTFLHGYAELERSGMFGASGPQGGLDIGLNALLGQMEGEAPAKT